MSPPQQSIFKEYEDESGLLTKIWNKSANTPMLPIGIAGLIGVLAIGARQFKNRGQTSTSVYLMQLRVAAQGAVVGALTLSIAYSLVQDYVLKRPKQGENGPEH